jgi:hypothetical protein
VGERGGWGVKGGGGGRGEKCSKNLKKKEQSWRIFMILSCGHGAHSLVLLSFLYLTTNEVVFFSYEVCLLGQALGKSHLILSGKTIGLEKS